MLLRSVRLENYRALKFAEIALDPTTVLIGENDCGRSSVLEAVALAMGWNATEDEFRFQPFHLHRAGSREPSPALSLSVTLEFSESEPREWESEGFEVLRARLPGALGRERRFRLEVTYSHAGATHWAFRATGQPPLTDDRTLLAWLRRRMPVFWMNEGLLAARRFDAFERQLADADANRLAEQVNQRYGELLEGSTPDAAKAIEAGSKAARQLLLSRAKLLAHHTTTLGEVLEEATGKRKPRRLKNWSEPLENMGTAAYKIGVLLLVGALLRAGAGRMAQGMDPLTLLEDPEAHLHPTTLASIWSVIERVGGQKIIATHSGAVLTRARLTSVRRLTRCDGVVKQWRVPEGSLTADELRRYAYHLRSRRSSASFARCWLLVEGETEFWMMSELARVCGYDFAAEGVICVEFAQCGLSALLKVAAHLGIEWRLLADGDTAGQQYARTARERFRGSAAGRITLLEETDLEHCFWRYGYQEIFRRAAYPQGSAGTQTKAAPKSVIARAIDRHSKPYLAVLLLDAAIDRGRDGVPPPLRRAIEACVRLARHGTAPAK